MPLLEQHHPPALEYALPELTQMRTQPRIDPVLLEERIPPPPTQVVPTAIAFTPQRTLNATQVPPSDHTWHASSQPAPLIQTSQGGPIAVPFVLQRTMPTTQVPRETGASHSRPLASTSREPLESTQPTQKDSNNFGRRKPLAQPLNPEWADIYHRAVQKTEETKSLKVQQQAMTDRQRRTCLLVIFYKVRIYSMFGFNVQIS